MAELTEAFDDALTFVTDRHSDQYRKGASVPYVSHLLGTCALVLEAGGNETEAIAALLHDALEDRKATYQEIAERFGERVASIVRECSDTETHPKPPWRQRKQRYLEELPHHSQSAILVSSADKLHNLRTILSDYRKEGEKLWKRFNPDSNQIWYYSELARIFDAADSPLAAELNATLRELRTLVDANSS